MNLNRYFETTKSILKLNRYTFFLSTGIVGYSFVSANSLECKISVRTLAEKCELIKKIKKVSS